MKKQLLTMSLQGCFELFLDRCERENLSPATIQFYVDNIGHFIRYLYNEHSLENPIIKDFRAEYINKYLMKVKNGKRWERHTQIISQTEKLCSQSVRTYTRALRAVGN